MQVVYQSSQNIVIEEVENKNLGIVIIIASASVAIILFCSLILGCYVWDQKKINEKRSEVIKLNSKNKKAKIGFVDSETQSLNNMK